MADRKFIRPVRTVRPGGREVRTHPVLAHWLSRAAQPTARALSTDTRRPADHNPLEKDRPWAGVPQQAADARRLKATLEDVCFRLEDAFATAVVAIASSSAAHRISQETRAADGSADRKELARHVYRTLDQLEQDKEAARRKRTSAAVRSGASKTPAALRRTAVRSTRRAVRSTEHP